MKRMLHLVVILVFGFTGCNVTKEETQILESDTNYTIKTLKPEEDSTYIIEALIPPTYEFDNVFNFSDDGFASVQTSGKWGVVNAEGRLVVPVIYEYSSGDLFEGFFNGLAIVMRDGKYGYINDKGNVIIPLEYEYGSNFKNGFAGVYKDEKYGIIDTSGTVVVPFEYDLLSVLPTNLAVAEINGKYGIIDMTGNEVVPFIYEYISALPFDFNYDYHLFAFRQNGKDALANLAGNLLTDYVYEHIDFFFEGLALMRKETGKWGYIDVNGAEVIPAVYDNGFHFYNGLANVTKEGVDSFIDLTGALAFEGNALGFDDSYYLTLLSDDNGKWGVLDRTGKIVVPIEYDDICIYDDVIIWVNNRAEQISGYFDKDGNVVIPLRHTNGGYSSKPAEGLIGLEKNNKWGYVDYAGNVVIDFEYDAVGSFSAGFAPVQKDGIWGYIDKSGHEISEFQYDDAQCFSGGFAWVQKNGKWGILTVKP